MIEVIDYGGGNLGSLLRCLERLSLPFVKVDKANPPTGKHPLLLPGVGAFGAAMNNLHTSGMTQRIRDLVRSGVPYLGICIGLQVLFDSSEEAPGVEGLGLIPGEVKAFQVPKVPQIGWNPINSTQPEIYPDGCVYFVNSYYGKPNDSQAILYQANYGGPFCAGVQQGNITAFQFHPEKSGAFGHDLIRRWHQAQ